MNCESGDSRDILPLESDKDEPLQRCFRDLHTARQHIEFNPNWLQSFARTRFG